MFFFYDARASYEIDIIAPGDKEVRGLFFATEAESIFHRIDLKPLQNDLDEILRMLNNITDYARYEISELTMTAGAASEESGKKRAGLSLKLLSFGGELGKSEEMTYSENSLIQIKIKRKS